MTDPSKTDEPAELLKRSRVEVSEEIFTILSISHEQWLTLLENPALSPRMNVPFLIFRDRWEVTMIVNGPDSAVIKEFLGDAPAEANWRLLSFDAGLDFDVVGFIALVSRILADAGIPILPIASYSRDHVFVKQDDLAASLIALRGHVAEVC